MCPIVLTWMRFADVDEDESEAFGGIFLRHSFERWRRQRTIWSGEGTEFYQHITFAPVVAEFDRLTRFQEDGGEVGCGRADLQGSAEADEVFFGFEGGVVVGVGVGGFGHRCFL